MEIRNRFVLIFKPQVAQGVHEERRAAAHFIAQHGNARACVVESFDDDKFQLIAQKLLDRGLMLFFDFRVVGQYTHGAELLPAATRVRSKEFLHRLSRIRPVVQNLRQRRMPRPHARQRVAQRVRFFRQAIALPAQRSDFCLQFRGALLQHAELPRNSFQFMSRAFRVIACPHGGFQYFVFVCLQFPQRLGLVHQRFFRLLLLAVQPQQAFARFRRPLPQCLDTPFAIANLRRTLFRALQKFFDAPIQCAGFFAQQRHCLHLRRAARLPLRGLRARLFQFRIHLRVTPGQFLRALAVKRNFVLAAVYFERRQV